MRLLFRLVWSVPECGEKRAFGTVKICWIRMIARRIRLHLWWGSYSRLDIDVGELVPCDHQCSMADLVDGASTSTRVTS